MNMTSRGPVQNACTETPSNQRKGQEAHIRQAAADVPDLCLQDMYSRPTFLSILIRQTFSILRTIPGPPQPPLSRSAGN